MNPFTDPFFASPLSLPPNDRLASLAFNLSPAVFSCANKWLFIPNNKLIRGSKKEKSGPTAVRKIDFRQQRVT